MYTLYPTSVQSSTGAVFLGDVAPSQIHKTVSFFLEEHQKRWYVLFHGRERVSVGRISTMTATREQGRQDLDAALVKAAGDGEPHTVAVLIGLGADVEAVDEDGKKALMLAAQEGHTDIVNALAGTHNANVDAVDQSGKTALMFAAENGHTDTVNALSGTHNANVEAVKLYGTCLLYTSPSPRDGLLSRMPSSA